jgi:hypothetical protein
MKVTLFQRGELLRMARIIAALLSLVAGIVLIAQTMITDLVPAPAGYAETQAQVVGKYQRGTFSEPAFSLTLRYSATDQGQAETEIRSGLRVEYDQYYRTAVGDLVHIYYDSDAPYSWQIVEHKSGARDYAPGIMLALIGGMLWLFPLIINLASRQEDFEFSEEMKAQ